MEQVTLYREERPDIKISIIAYFNDKDDLEISGYDVHYNEGGVIEDADYEYQAIVKKEDITLLKKVMNMPTNEAILKALETRFNDNYCFSNLLKFFKQHQIPYTDFYWR